MLEDRSLMYHVAAYFDPLSQAAVDAKLTAPGVFLPSFCSLLPATSGVLEVVPHDCAARGK